MKASELFPVSTPALVRWSRRLNPWLHPIETRRVMTELADRLDALQNLTIDDAVKQQAEAWEMVTAHPSMLDVFDRGEGRGIDNVYGRLNELLATEQQAKRRRAVESLDEIAAASLPPTTDAYLAERAQMLAEWFDTRGMYANAKLVRALAARLSA